MTRDVEPVRILVVDDDPKNLLALEAVLGDRGWTLVNARSGAEALRHLLHEDFAVVLLDVNMPGMDGFEAATLIRRRERSRDTPIIFLTAAIKSDTNVARGYSLGAVDYILKPIDPEILRSKVAVFVDLFRKAQEVRRQAAELQETTALLHSILESSTAYAILALDMDGRVLVWNEGARRMFGYAADEMAGREPFSLLLDPDEPADNSPAQLIREALEGEAAEASLRFRRKNGESFTGCVALNYRSDGTGAPTGFVAVVQDITDRLRAEREREQRLREEAAHAEAEAARRRFALLAEASHVLSSELDYSLTLQALARFAVPRLADLCIVDLVGMDTTEETRRELAVGPLPEAVAAAELLQARAPSRSGGGGLGRVLRLGQARLWPDLSASDLSEVEPDPEVTAVLARMAPSSALMVPLRSRGGILGAMTWLRNDPDHRYDADDLALALDLADRAALALDNAHLYGAAREAVRLRDEFLASATHDLRTPLTVIKAQSQLLQRRLQQWEAPELARASEMLGRVDQATTRMIQLVQQVLDVAQIEAGQPLQLDLAPTDIVALARELAHDLAAQSSSPISVQSEEPSFIGSWDSARIERVLANLVGNAVKYSPTGSPVEVEIRRAAEGEGDWVEVIVRDQGVGIPAEDLPRIFNRFYRARNVVGKFYGTGIGLAAARQIVEQHGGRIFLASQEGVGTTVHVLLPLAEPAALCEEIEIPVPGAESESAPLA